MINRRIIRIKVLQTLFSYNSGALDDLDKAEKDLIYTFERIYDLYHNILLLLVELSDFANLKIEKAKTKLITTEDDLNPNTKFVDNKIFVQLKENRQLNEYLNDRKYSWTNNNQDVLKDIYQTFSESEEFIKYMNSDDNSYDADKRILLYLIEIILYNCKSLYSTLEEESIFWIDNIDFVLLATTITVDKLSIGHDMNRKLLRQFKNNDDKDFAIELLHKTILNSDKYTEIIKKNIINWDFKRISFIDRIILQMSLAELIEFPEIPIKVSLNEYIELAKKYGIPKKSSNFVNGILDKIVKNLKKENIIKKTGRGLKDN
ncbi:MAG: transcription antitermination factor NusB [Bacteroidota bacterium]|nr:transcription antitermination factor NusB [Bacteroidota bacterium]